MTNNCFFSHDSNARNSKKMIRLRQKLGAAGYGIYWMLIERLREEDSYSSERDYDMIAFDLRADSDTIRAVVEDFGLFDISEDGATFTSHGLQERMEIAAAKARAGRRGAAARNGSGQNGNQRDIAQADAQQNPGRTSAEPLAEAQQTSSRTPAEAQQNPGRSSAEVQQSGAPCCDSADANKIKLKEIKENNNSPSYIPPPCVGEEGECEEDEEKEEIVSYFTFKNNWLSPNAEYEKMVAHYNRPEQQRKWDSMSAAEHMSLRARWKQMGEPRSRYDKDTLRAVRQIYDIMCRLGTPFDVRMGLLSDGLKFRKDKVKKSLAFVCPERLWRYIEVPPDPDTPPMLEHFRPVLKELLDRRGCMTLEYDYENFTE